MSIARKGTGAGGGAATGNAAPQPLGTAAAGSSNNASREDHVHAMPSAAGVGAVDASQVGAPNGIAQLDATQKIPTAQMPAAAAFTNDPRTETASFAITAGNHANRRTEYNSAAAGNATFNNDATSLLVKDDGGRIMQLGAGPVTIVAGTATILQLRGVPLTTTGPGSYIDWEHGPSNTIVLTGYGGGNASLSHQQTMQLSNWNYAYAYNGGISYALGGTHSVVGTLSNISFDTSTPHTTAKTALRTRNTSSTAAGSEASYVGTALGVTSYDTSDVNGGFPLNFDMVPITDANSGSLIAFGFISTLTPTWSNMEPHAIVDRYLLVAADSGDANLQIMINNNNAGGATKIDTGIAKPAQGQRLKGSIDKSSDGLTFIVTIYNPDTRAVNVFTINGQANQPDNTRLYYPCVKRGNLGNGAAVSFDFIGISRGRSQ